MLKKLLVRDWMSTKLTTATPQTSLSAAYQLMKENKVRHLPILNNGRVISLIHKTDIRRAKLAIAATYPEEQMRETITRLKTVGEIMEYQPVIVQADDSIEVAAKLLLDKKLTGLPVLENGQLVGMITESDLFRLVIELSQTPS